MATTQKVVFSTMKTRQPLLLWSARNSHVVFGLMSLILAAQSTHAAEETENDKVAVLPTIQVSAQKNEATEKTKSYTVSETNASTGLALSLKETPQSVTVVTRQQLDDKAAQTIDDVLGQTTGITYTQQDNGGRTTYRARGYAISNYKADGLSIVGGSGFSGAGNSINLDLYDHVSIVRGANGLLGGTGDPSATIDLVRKRPTKDFTGSLTLRGGSWDKRNIVGDINVPLTADGRIRSRLVVSAEDSDSFRDKENTKRQGVLASIEMDATDSTTLGVGFQYENNEMHGTTWGTNVPIWFADGTRTNFGRSYNPVTDWSKSQREGKTFFTSLDSQFDNGWKLSTRYAHTEREDVSNIGLLKVNNGSGGTYTVWNADGTGAYLNAFHNESSSENNALDIALSGKFNLFGREHDLMFGLNGSDLESTGYGVNCSVTNVSNGVINTASGSSGCQIRKDTTGVNWNTWSGSEFTPLVATRTGATSVTHTTLYGGYAAARFRLTDDLSLITGVRRSNYKVYTHAYDASGKLTAQSGYNTAQAWTPYYGLVYNLTPTYSFYASYTDVFTPQTQKNRAGDVLDPIVGQSYEAGVKGAWFDDRLNASVATFKTKQKNNATADGLYTVEGSGDQAYFEGAGIQTQGFETEISGAITPQWNVYAGYTYLDVDDKSSTDRPDPRHLFRLNTTYDVSRFVNGLTIGGGMSWQSYTVNTPNPGRPLGDGTYDATPLKVKGHALFDVMARYKLNDHFSASLNVSNLFDKTYYRQFGFYDGLIYGEPRRITLTLQTRF
ncbi:MAG: TonB-dependent siderophore receptor [Acinetobacter sp.]